jgi:hypothetical protein
MINQKETPVFKASNNKTLDEHLKILTARGLRLSYRGFDYTTRIEKRDNSSIGTH